MLLLISVSRDTQTSPFVFLSQACWPFYEPEKKKNFFSSIGGNVSLWTCLYQLQQLETCSIRFDFLYLGGYGDLCFSSYQEHSRLAVYAILHPERGNTRSSSMTFNPPPWRAFDLLLLWEASPKFWLSVNSEHSDLPQLGQSSSSQF